MSIVKQIAKPNLVDVLEAHKNDVFYTMNCVQIGRIESFDPATQTASILLLLKTIQETSPEGVSIYQQRPVLLQCPVMTLFGGNAFLSMPIQVGDNCIVLFNDREIDTWFTAGGLQTPVSVRMHDASDAIAIVGIRPLVDLIATYLSNGIRLSYGDNGTCQIDLQEAAINSLAALFTHTGNMKITGTLEVENNVTMDADLTILGTMGGNGGTITATDIITSPQLKSGNGATGSFNIVTVVDGIVTGGS